MTGWIDGAPVERIACIAPACGRGIGVAAWRKRFGDLEVETAEYVCQRHWTQVPSAMRAVYARARRRDRRIGAHMASTHRIWRRIVTEITARP